MNTKIKPEFEGKLIKVGNVHVITVPAFFKRMWDMRKGARYKVQILSEVKEAFYGFCSPNPI